jgi:hypothetical protein
MAKKKRKPKSRRSQQEHPDLDPKFNLRSRLELIDQDYLDKLSPEELKWLNQFNREYVSASLDSENPRKNLHRNKKLRKSCYDQNNSRNRDVLTRAKAAKLLIDYETLIEESDYNDYEEKLINELDKKQTREAIDWLAEQLDKDETVLENQLINETKGEKK